MERKSIVLIYVCEVYICEISYARDNETGADLILMGFIIPFED